MTLRERDGARDLDYVPASVVMASGRTATGPVLVTAIQEQLGLRFERPEEMMDGLVIDYAEMPTQIRDWLPLPSRVISCQIAVPSCTEARKTCRVVLRPSRSRESVCAMLASVQAVGRVSMSIVLAG